MLGVPPLAGLSNGSPPLGAGPAPAARWAVGRRARSGRRARRRPVWLGLGKGGSSRGLQNSGGRRAGGRGGTFARWGLWGRRLGRGGRDGRGGRRAGVALRSRLGPCRFLRGGSGPLGPGLVGGAAGAGRAALPVRPCPAARPQRFGPPGLAPAQRLHVRSPCVV